MQYLAIAPHAWARKPTREEAEREAKRNVPTFVKDKGLLAVFGVEPNSDDEWPYLDGMGMLRVPTGSEVTEIWRKDG